MGAQISERLFRVAAIAVLLAGLLVGTASGASPESGPVVRVELDLPTNNDLHAHLETSEKGEVTLEIWRGGDGVSQSVTYEVPGEVSEAGLKVRFGRLGLIDVAFTPTVTLDETAPSPGCTGAPRTLREGVFAGTIALAGERGYVRIEAPQATGSMSVIAPWQCPKEDGLNPFEPVPGFSRMTARPARGERESASLVAFTRGFHGAFGAGVHHRHSGGRSIFFGAREERREGVEILRATSVQGPASDFDFDFGHRVHTATLDPPLPLKGHASFRGDRRGGFWRSTIRVPLLGSPPLRTGRGFGAALYPEYQFD
ncbi:MAG TPA: hypothetical protein VHP56_00450 [Solirubrobacterales bacterium]|jgi:hypothetical protein|nr:hypothetical protein [Solirubrobacterales bacterium]